MGLLWAAVGGPWRLSTDCGEGSGCRRRQMRQLAWTLLLLTFLVGLDPGSGGMTQAPAVGEHRVLQYVNSSDTGSGQTEYTLELGEDSVVDLLLVGGGGGGSTGLPPLPLTHQSCCLLLASAGSACSCLRPTSGTALYRAAALPL